MPGSPEESIGFILHDVARLMRKRFEQRARAAELGATRAQCQVLVNLAMREGINQSALAQHLDLEPITLVRILDRLADAGLIERRADPRDRRARKLYLTDAARPLLDRIWELAAEVRADALAGVGKSDQERLLAILKSMRSNIVEVLSEPNGVDEVLKRAHG